MLIQADLVSQGGFSFSRAGQPDTEISPRRFRPQGIKSGVLEPFRIFRQPFRRSSVLENRHKYQKTRQEAQYPRNSDPEGQAGEKNHRESQHEPAAGRDSEKHIQRSRKIIRQHIHIRILSTAIQEQIFFVSETEFYWKTWRLVN